MVRLRRMVLLGVGLAAMTARVFAAEATLVADAHVNSALPGVNSGAISNLNVGGGYTALLQFDLGTLPAGVTAAQVTRATLRLYCNRMDAAGVVSVQPVGAAWGEYSVTYATLPALRTAVQQIMVSQAGVFVTVDVTALVQGWISAPSSNYGVALTAGSAEVQFDSKENDLTGHTAALDVTLAAVGAQGPAGPMGLTGPQGPQGVPGAQGPEGFQGPEGPLGPQGFAGLTGAPGPQGVPGVAGPAGPQGAVGVAGPVGPQGQVGLSGPQGAAGPVGMMFQGTYSPTVNYGLADGVIYHGSGYVSLVAGNRGNPPDGSPGAWTLFATGTAGAMGPAGAQGPVGPVGPQGVAGAAGPVGAAGPAGATGPQGPPVAFAGGWLVGTTYPVGSAVSYGGSSYIALVMNAGRQPDLSPVYWGLLAQAGAPGPIGPNGATGAQGPTGFPGAQGATGAVGPAGPMGPAGSIGATGPAGPQGPVGATGAAGPAGMVYRGSYSASINYGFNDAVSFGGASYISLLGSNHGNPPDQSPAAWGLLAAQGATGGVGPAGATGAQGPAGLQGPQGVAGPAGAPGAVGVRYRGAWAFGAAYLTNDVAGYGGTTYLATANSSGAEPDVSPTMWAVLAVNGSAGATGPAGAAASVSVGTVTTGAAGTAATVTNSGTAAAAVLNFTIPQGAAGTSGSGGGGGGGTSGIPFASIYHAVSFNYSYYSVNSSNASATEGESVLTWVPAGCTATELEVFSRQGNAVTVTLRQGTPGAMAMSALSCTAASGGSCMATGAVAVPAGNFVDLEVSGANGLASGVWMALACN